MFCRDTAFPHDSAELLFLLQGPKLHSASDFTHPLLAWCVL